FTQTPFAIHDARVQLAHLLLRLTAVLGDGGHFLGVEPDKAGRACAAMAAARAFKTQAFAIPGVRHRWVFLSSLDHRQVTRSLAHHISSPPSRAPSPIFLSELS